MHNGYCAKWKCESTSSNAGRCEAKDTHTYTGPSWARLEAGGCINAISNGLVPNRIDLFCVACAANQIAINGGNEKHCVLGQSSADHSSVSILYQGLQSVPFSWTGLPEVVALFPHAPIIVIRESDSSSTDCQKVADTEKTFFHLQHTNVCQSNTACNNLSQSQCSNNTTCTRQPGSSSNSSPQCIRADGKAATDEDCASIGDKPSCGGDSSSPMPEAGCTSGWYRYEKESIWIQEVTYTDGEIICEEEQGSKHHQPHQSLLQCDKYLSGSGFTCPKMDKAIHHSLLFM